MKITRVIPMCKNVFAIKMLLIDLKFYVLDFTKDYNTFFSMSRNDLKSVLLGLGVF